MNRDSPSLNELYGVGAEEADSEALEEMDEEEEIPPPSISGDGV